jgi:hypothetical protein
MSEWKKFGSPDWPHWGDEGKRVQVKYRDSTEAEGVLVMEDMTPGPDELPLFTIRKDDGTQASWFDAEFWRYAVSGDPYHVDLTPPSDPVTVKYVEPTRWTEECRWPPGTFDGEVSKIAQNAERTVAGSAAKFTDHPYRSDVTLQEVIADSMAVQRQLNERLRLYEETHQELRRENEMLRSRGTWQPIATAPKDRRILLYDPTYGGLHDPVGEGSIFVGQWGQFRGWTDGDFDMQPTHWMQLPETPK